MFVLALKHAGMTLASVPAGFKALPLSIAHLSLPVVLKCGQSFRWSNVIHDNSQIEWRLTLPDRVVCLRQTHDTLYYRAIFPVEEHAVHDKAQDTTLAWLKDYFQLDVDLVKLFSTVHDPVFQGALGRFEGAIRMLRQDPWESLISCAPKFPAFLVFFLTLKHLIDSSVHRIIIFPALLAWFRISALIFLQHF